MSNTVNIISRAFAKLSFLEGVEDHRRIGPAMMFVKTLEANFGRNRAEIFLDSCAEAVAGRVRSNEHVLGPMIQPPARFQAELMTLLALLYDEEITSQIPGDVDPAEYFIGVKDELEPLLAIIGEEMPRNYEAGVALYHSVRRMGKVNEFMHNSHKYDEHLKSVDRSAGK